MTSACKWTLNMYDLRRKWMKERGGGHEQNDNDNVANWFDEQCYQAAAADLSWTMFVEH